MWHLNFFSGSNCSWSQEQFPAPAPRQIHPGNGSPALPWGLAGHAQGRLIPGRIIIIRQVYNPHPVLQSPPSPVSTWTAGFQQHRSSTAQFQSCPVPAPCPSTGSASASWLQRCRNPRWHGTVLPTAGLLGSAPPLLLPVALPLLLETGLVWRGKQMLCMVGIFPASICAGGGWTRSAELSPRWVQSCLRRTPGIPQGSSAQGKQEGLCWEKAGSGKGMALPVPGIRDVCPAAPAAAGPLAPCHPPTPSQRDFGFPLLCRASIPSSASL